jgi:hypothetical protein
MNGTCDLCPAGFFSSDCLDHLQSSCRPCPSVFSCPQGAVQPYLPSTTLALIVVTCRTLLVAIGTDDPRIRSLVLHRKYRANYGNKDTRLLKPHIIVTRVTVIRQANHTAHQTTDYSHTHHSNQANLFQLLQASASI